MQRASQVGDTDTEQPAQKGSERRAEEHACDSERGMIGSCLLLWQLWHEQDYLAVAFAGWMDRNLCGEPGS